MVEGIYDKGYRRVYTVECIHGKKYIWWRVYTMDGTHAYAVRVYIVESTYGERYIWWRVHIIER